MLRPAAVTLMLSQLISIDNDQTYPKPHTALLSLVESSELYAYATRLADYTNTVANKNGTNTPSSLSISSASTLKQHSRSKSAPLSCDERVMCLSAIAVASWRHAVSNSFQINQHNQSQDVTRSFIAGPGMKVTVSKYPVSEISREAWKKTQSQELVPLLLECEFGRILVMPIIPVNQPSTSSQADPTSPAQPAQDAFGNHPALTDVQQPFMLLTLNASVSRPSLTARSFVQVAPPTPKTTTRSRFLSGSTTPNSPHSTATVTSSRSSTVDPGATLVTGQEKLEEDEEEGTSHENTSDSRPDSAVMTSQEDEVVWATMYAQARAFARHLAPSLAKCGVGDHHLDHDEHAEGRRSSQAMSEDEMDY